MRNSNRPPSLRRHAQLASPGIQPGDRIVKINGKEYRTSLLPIGRSPGTARLKRWKSSEYWECEVEKAEAGVGVSLRQLFEGIKPCCNHCLFCFVDQMPPKLRPSLYIKDDDYRLFTRKLYYFNESDRSQLAANQRLR